MRFIGASKGYVFAGIDDGQIGNREQSPEGGRGLEVQRVQPRRTWGYPTDAPEDNRGDAGFRRTDDPVGMDDQMGSESPEWFERTRFGPQKHRTQLIDTLPHDSMDTKQISGDMAPAVTERGRLLDEFSQAMFQKSVDLLTEQERFQIFQALGWSPQVVAALEAAIKKKEPSGLAGSQPSVPTEPYFVQQGEENAVTPGVPVVEGPERFSEPGVTPIERHPMPVGDVPPGVSARDTNPEENLVPKPMGAPASNTVTDEYHYPAKPRKQVERGREMYQSAFLEFDLEVL